MHKHLVESLIRLQSSCYPGPSKLPPQLRLPKHPWGSLWFFLTETSFSFPPNGSFHSTSCNMTVFFSRANGSREREQECMLKMVVWELTKYHICHKLLDTQTICGIVWEKTTEDCEYQEQGWLGSLWRLGIMERTYLILSETSGHSF